MLAVARTLNEVGYRYMLMPDHMPSHADDPRRIASLRVRLWLYQGAAAGYRVDVAGLPRIMAGYALGLSRL